jgi:hypothetical protein
MDRRGSDFGGGNSGLVHCRVQAFAMLNTQVSLVLVRVFLVCSDARLTRIEAKENNFAFVNIFLLS